MDDLKKTIISLLNRHIGDISLIYLFGSILRRAGNNRDIDVAFLAEEEVGNVKRWEIAQDFASSLKKDVDLVDLSKASTVLKVQVVGKGECIFEADKTKRGFFEMCAFSAYARLNEERKIILERTEKEGTIYAR